MLPTNRQIEVPLLEAITELGGQAKARDIYPRVTKKFPQIRDEDLMETLPSGANKWTNRIQWARQRLVTIGELDSPSHGVWRITDRGRRRVSAPSEAKPSEPPPSLIELYEGYQASFRAHLLNRLRDLEPAEFEQFAGKLLRAYGFADVKVTNVSQDGGIDGYGRLRLGLATMNVAFQCKRWQGNVGRPEVDKFRGAIQGEFEQGVFFTTADFTPTARDASLKMGAVPIILLNRESLVDLMIEKGLGVERVPLYAYFDRPSDLSRIDED